MIDERLQRTAFLIGQKPLQELQQKHICVFGVGGVGGQVIDTLARSGIGELTIVDHDTVSLSNINRQYVATSTNVGQLKVDVMQKHINDINPKIKVHSYPLFYLPQNADDFPLQHFDYIIDAIDNVSAKVALIKRAKKFQIPIISAMGCGNRLDPSQVEINDLFKISYDPLAKVMRYLLRKENIFQLDIVHSKEKPIKPIYDDITAHLKKKPPGSSSFVPPVAGIHLAYYVIKELTKEKD